MKNILVTGCGGDIGYGLGKIIKTSSPITNKLIGCDLNPDNPSIRFYDAIEKICSISLDDYITQLSEIINKYHIDLVIPMSEPELRVLNDRNIRKVNGVNLLMPDKKTMDVGFDKYKTYSFLKSHGLPHPRTTLANDGKNIFYPCILKGREGSGRKQVFLVESEDFLSKHEGLLTDKNIFQELLLPEDQEYTCGIYRTLTGDIRTIIFRRYLSAEGGYSERGNLAENSDISNLLMSVANKLDLRGSINVQLRLTEDGPKIFEINPRFSSTVVFRHLLGFNDVLWAINEAFNMPLNEYLPERKNMKFFKVFDEFILEV
jgi:carbamoyl-phosphate synthase large subunit